MNNSLRLILLITICLLWVLPIRAQQMFVSSSASAIEVADIYYEAAVMESDANEASSLYQMARDKYLEYLEAASPSDTNIIASYLHMASISAVLNPGGGERAGYLSHALASAKQLLDPVSPRYCELLILIASQCIEAGDDVQGYRFLKEAKPLIGNDPDLKCKWLVQMSYIELNASRRREASYMLKSAVGVSRKALRQDPSADHRLMYATTLMMYASTMIVPRGARYIKKAYEEYSRYVYERFNRMSEVARARYWGSVAPIFDGILLIAENVPDVAYDALLLSKGILLNTSIEFQNFVKESGDTLAIRYQEERNKLIAEGAPSRLADSLDILIVNRLDEKNLPFKESAIVHWRDVRDALDRDDLAIEFFEASDSSWGALLLKRDLDRPLYRHYDSTWNQDIQRYFPKTDKGRIFFSPYGKFNLKPIEYDTCAIPGLGNKCMAEVFKMYRLSSTAELVKTKGARLQEVSKAGVFGGVKYSAGREELESASHAVLRGGSMPDSAYESVIDDPGSRYDDPAPLPWSAWEAHAIDSLLSAYQMNVDLFTGKYASEEAVEAHSGAENILHFATHGFYASTKDVENDKYQYYTRLFTSHPELLMDPLYRSGLQMAGAGHVWDAGWDGTLLAEGLSDGILTAREISLMDLRGVDLVVLSACDSGQGELTGDGVYGLPRAFKKAGVGAILMSLKPINDDASTRFLMTCFYLNCLIGKDKQTAFMEALNLLRRNPEWDKEDVWKSFILMDALPGD